MIAPSVIEEAVVVLFATSLEYPFSTVVRVMKTSAIDRMTAAKRMLVRRTLKMDPE